MWGYALLTLAVAMVVLLPLAGLLRDQGNGRYADDRDLALSAALREAFAHRGFWLLNFGFFACGFQLAFIATHLPAYVRDKGLQPSVAVAALAVVALANVFGTYCFGLLGGRFRGKYLLTGIYLVRTAAMALCSFFWR